MQSSGEDANQYSLAKIAEEVNEIKQLVSGKKERAAEEAGDLDKEIVFGEFPPLAQLEAE